MAQDPKLGAYDHRIPLTGKQPDRVYDDRFVRNGIRLYDRQVMSLDRE
jgi:hypothetical protein